MFGFFRLFFDVALKEEFAVSGTNIFDGTSFGGVYLSSIEEGDWKAVNNGLTASEVLSLAISGNYIFAGTDQFGVWKRSLSDILGVKNITADNNNSY